LQPLLQPYAAATRFARRHERVVPDRRAERDIRDDGRDIE